MIYKEVRYDVFIDSFTKLKVVDYGLQLNISCLSHYGDHFYY